MRTWISLSSDSFRGDALPDLVAVELGEGYRLDGSMISDVNGGKEGDLLNSLRGELGGDVDILSAACSMVVGDCRGGWRSAKKVVVQN